MERTQYEYLVAYNYIDRNDLNQLGRQGWELVTVINNSDYRGSACVMHFFKREL